MQDNQFCLHKSIIKLENLSVDLTKRLIIKYIQKRNLKSK